MPFIAHATSEHYGLLPRTVTTPTIQPARARTSHSAWPMSIALIWWISLLQPSITVAQPATIAAAPNLALPALGNTNDQDRRMLKEIGNDHIHDSTTNRSTINGHPPSRLSLDSGRTDVKSTARQNASATPGHELPPTNNSVWQRIRNSQRIPLKNHAKVQLYREQFAREALWISKILHRGKPFLAHIVAALEQRFLPVELALLPAIESGYQPQARSAGNAAGIWQIVPITAREIGIKRSVWFDGRADIIASTTAAIDYLSYLNAEFNGDWELTLAAYNAGPGRVRSAIKKK